MNKYGELAMEMWSQAAPSQYAQIEDPETFFSALGVQAQNQISQLTFQLTGPDEPGENYWHKVGRINAAKRQAEEIVREELLMPLTIEDVDDGPVTEAHLRWEQQRQLELLYAEQDRAEQEEYDYQMQVEHQERMKHYPQG